MKILADENIPYVREAFRDVGDVVTLSGRAITSDALRDVSILLVRSVTRVNAALLDGSSVRFVATATIGEDHIDKAYLARRGIGFSAAPGSNANSVAEYVVAALLVLQEQHGILLQDATLGIVGVGNVGARVAVKATALGLRCVWNDPPLARKTGDERYRPMDEILDCDIITLHVPLTLDGPDATHHLVDDTVLQRIKPGVALINTARGPVADTNALKQAIRGGRLGACVLDVWEREPDVDIGLLECVSIGTPHIAGYSFDGKVNGTRQIYEAVCRFLDMPPTWDPTPLLPKPACPQLFVRGDAPDLTDAVRNAVLSVYDIRRDDAAMRRLLDIPASQRRQFFDTLRKEYPQRREFMNTRVTVLPPNERLRAKLEGIGFRIEQ